MTSLVCHAKKYRPTVGFHIFFSMLFCVTWLQLNELNVILSCHVDNGKLYNKSIKSFRWGWRTGKVIWGLCG